MIGKKKNKEEVKPETKPDPTPKKINPWVKGTYKYGEWEAKNPKGS
tara:strand:+ start:2232 stop:2369 length:138 start_codon:yes stop_codon:yes gene_type:complete